jgi:hypothetical protein
MAVPHSRHTVERSASVRQAEPVVDDAAVGSAGE